MSPAPLTPSQIADWRREERTRLLDNRRQLTAERRASCDAGLIQHLNVFLDGRLRPGNVISFYWPIKGEPDLRSLMHDLHDRGIQIALPLVETKASPLVFRLWTPETRMVRGHWNILVPPPDAEAVRPDVILAPLVGWDRKCYRLGYGGGYFDRTLAALRPAPVTIGIGLDEAELPTIHPLPHDIRLDVIITPSDIHRT